MQAEAVYPVPRSTSVETKALSSWIVDKTVVTLDCRVALLERKTIVRLSLCVIVLYRLGSGKAQMTLPLSMLPGKVEDSVVGDTHHPRGFDTLQWETLSAGPFAC
jgi:hypothetical protein